MSSEEVIKQIRVNMWTMFYSGVVTGVSLVSIIISVAVWYGKQ